MFRVSIDVEAELQLSDGIHEEFVFRESSESDRSSEDSNAADNPNFSYPEDESDSFEDSDDGDLDSDDFEQDPYNSDADLDAIDDYDQS